MERDTQNLINTFELTLFVYQIVNPLKGVSSCRYEQAEYKKTKKPHKESLWSPSYFAVSVEGMSLEVLTRSWGSPL